MSYFKRVSPKIVIKISDSSYGKIERGYVRAGCDFHRCWGFSHNIKYNSLCNSHKNVLEKLAIRGKWYEAITINHYARSLEKFELKTQSWETSNSAYNLIDYFDRSVGWTLDSLAAQRYSCQVRAILHKMTGKEKYLRPGDMWIRNVEFGKAMTYASKAKRDGETIVNGFTFRRVNPYHYELAYGVNSSH